MYNTHDPDAPIYSTLYILYSINTVQYRGCTVTLYSTGTYWKEVREIL